MQFQVPQNIDMEDKIIGPMTLTQFIYLIVGGTIVYIILMKTPTIVFILLGIPIAVLTLGFTFVKIQDRPMSHFAMAFIDYLIKPKQRVWAKGTVAETPITMEVKKKKETPVVQKKINKSELERLAQVLDTGGWSSMNKVETLHTQKQEFVQNPQASVQPAPQAQNPGGDNQNNIKPQ